MAEILVTLAVIGVVASMTIPALMRDVQDKQFKTAFKKNYAVISQATRMLMADNGGELAGAFSSYEDMRNEYLPYLKYIKSCAGVDSLDNCWNTDTYLLKGDLATSDNGAPSIVLNNGAFLKFSYESSDCSAPFGSLGNGCGNIIIDVNGFKGPNTYGKDIFAIHILRNDVKPEGIPGDSAHGCFSSETGFGCAYNVLMDIDY